MPMANSLVFGFGSCRRRKGSCGKRRSLGNMARRMAKGNKKKDKRTGSELQGAVE